MSGRILIIDSCPSHRALLRDQLEHAYFSVFTVDNASKALEEALKVVADVILLNVELDDSDGVDMCRRLKAHPLLRQTPVVLMAPQNSDQQRVNGFEAGADDFLSKPVNADALFARMRSLARLRMMTEELKLRDATSLEFGLEELTPPLGDERRCRVGLVSQNPEAAKDMSEQLTDKLGINCFWVGSGLSAMRLMHTAPPDGFLICSDLTDTENSYALCAALTYHRDGTAPAIIMMTRGDDLGKAARYLDHGASDYIGSQYDMNELAARVRSQLRRKLYSERLCAFVRNGLRLSVTDPLTALYNRRYVDTHLSNSFEAARKTGTPLTVMAFDIDRFKQVNDRFGHSIGDQALRVFAERLRRNLRGVDLIARIGGEEFFAALPGVTLSQGCAAADRIRRIAAEPMPGAPRITVSAGVASLSEKDASSGDLLNRADKALYLAKTGGRNCVMQEAAA